MHALAAYGSADGMPPGDTLGKLDTAGLLLALLTAIRMPKVYLGIM